jgi:DNA repair exonuclease SbcCD ATPase subunit
MSQPHAGSALVQAVQAFDDELEKFAKAAASACRRNLESKRELEKAAESVREAGEAEKAMQQRAQELLAALKAAEAEQQSQAEALRARTTEIQARYDAYEQLAARYRQLGEEGAQLVEQAQKLRTDSGPGTAPPGKAELVLGLGDLEKRVADLRETARALAADARESKFEDLGAEAHSVEQTLSALRNKLLLAQRAAAATPSAGDA